MQKEESKKYLFWIIVILLVYLSYLIIKDFIISIVSAFILAYLLHPLHKKLSKKISSELSATLCIIFLIIIILGPLAIVTTSLTTQIYFFIKSLETNPITSISQKLENIPILSNLDLDKITQNVLEFFLASLSGIFSSLASLILSLLITLLGAFYILVDWDFLVFKLKTYIPVKNPESLVSKMSKTTNQIIYGTLLVAIIEFIISALGFYLFGVKFFFVLAFIIALTAFIPGIGPAIVWVPAAIISLIYSDIYSTTGIIITGLILTFGIDLFLRNKILSSKTKINAFIMLIGLLGGIKIFGLFGFIIGPLILIYTIKILQETINSN